MPDLIAEGLMYEGPDYDIGAAVDAARDLEWDGSHYWVINDDGSDNAVYQFNPDWTPTGVSHDLGAQNVQPRTVNWDGEYFLMTGNVSPKDKVFRYDSDWSYVDSIDTSGQDSDANGCVKIGDGYWVVGDNTNALYEYSAEALAYTGNSVSLASRPDGGGPPQLRGCTLAAGMIWVAVLGNDIVFEVDVSAGFTGRWFVTGRPGGSGREGVGYDGAAFWVADLGTDRVYSYVPDPPFTNPPTPEEVFKATFEDASGRDPLPTALLTREDARKLAGHNVLVYQYPPYVTDVTVPIATLDDYEKLTMGSDHWFKIPGEPLFKMGRWAKVQGRALRENALEVDLVLFTTDNPLCFVEPT